MKRRTLFVAVGLVGCVFALCGLVTLHAETTPGESKAALAQRPLARLFRANLGRAMTLKAELNITPEQRTQIGEIVKPHKPEMVNLAKTLAAKRRALRDAASAQPVEEAKIRAAATDLTSAIADSAVLRAKIRAEVMKVLTSDQIAIIEKSRAESDASVDKVLQEIQVP